MLSKFGQVWGTLFNIFNEEREIMEEGKSVDVRPVLTRFTRAFNVTGHPALSLPGGLSPSGLPIGMQLIGRPFGEKTLLRLGHAYETTFSFPSLPSLT